MDAAELRPLRVGEILDVAIKIYRSHFATLVKAVAVVVAPVQVVSAVVQASSSDESFFTSPGLERTGQPGEVDFGDFWVFLAGFLVVGLLSLIAGELATGASLKAVSDAYLGQEPEWRSSLRFAASRLRSLVWVAVLTFVALALGFLACVVPGLYLWVAWAVAVPVLLLEDRRGTAALRRSMNLVRGRWWPTCAAVILGVVLAGIVQTALSLLINGAVFVAGSENDLVLLASQAVTGAVSGVLVTPFSAALAAVLYFDLRVRKEGLDLELLAQRVGVEAAGGVRPAVLPPPPPSWPPPPPPPAWPPPPQRPGDWGG